MFSGILINIYPFTYLLTHIINYSGHHKVAQEPSSNNDKHEEINSHHDGIVPGTNVIANVMNAGSNVIHSISNNVNRKKNYAGDFNDKLCYKYIDHRFFKNYVDMKERRKNKVCNNKRQIENRIKEFIEELPPPQVDKELWTLLWNHKFNPEEDIDVAIAVEAKYMKLDAVKSGTSNAKRKLSRAFTAGILLYTHSLTIVTHSLILAHTHSL